MKTPILLVFITLIALRVTVIAEEPEPPLGAAYSQPKHSSKTFIEVYLQENLKGGAIRVEVPCELNNDARLKEVGIPNDSIQSMKIPDGVTVTLYMAAGFGGKSQSFTGKAATLGDLKGQASSLKAEIK